MKYYIQIIILLNSINLLYSQVNGNKPEWKFDKHGPYNNGFTSVSKGDILGDIQFNGFVNNKFIISNRVRSEVELINKDFASSKLIISTGINNLVDNFIFHNTGNFSVLNGNVSIKQGDVLVESGSIRLGSNSILTDKWIGINVDPNTIGGTHSLYVNGSILCTKVKISYFNNWPDYVLDPQYDLMNLDIVKKYIENNGHLPGVPSNKEVGSDKYDVASIIQILLKKIEENTLYIINLNEQINKLKNEKCNNN